MRVLSVAVFAFVGLVACKQNVPESTVKDDGPAAGNGNQQNAGTFTEKDLDESKGGQQNWRRVNLGQITPGSYNTRSEGQTYEKGCIPGVNPASIYGLDANNGANNPGGNNNAIALTDPNGPSPQGPAGAAPQQAPAGAASGMPPLPECNAPIKPYLDAVIAKLNQQGTPNVQFLQLTFNKADAAMTRQQFEQQYGELQRAMGFLLPSFLSGGAGGQPDSSLADPVAEREFDTGNSPSLPPEFEQNPLDRLKTVTDHSDETLIAQRVPGNDETNRRSWVIGSHARNADEQARTPNTQNDQQQAPSGLLPGPASQASTTPQGADLNLTAGNNLFERAGSERLGRDYLSLVMQFGSKLETGGAAGQEGKKLFEGLKGTAAGQLNVTAFGITRENAAKAEVRGRFFGPHATNAVEMRFLLLNVQLARVTWSNCNRGQPQQGGAPGTKRKRNCTRGTPEGQAPTSRNVGDKVEEAFAKLNREFSGSYNFSVGPIPFNVTWKAKSEAELVWGIELKAGDSAEVGTGNGQGEEARIEVEPFAAEAKLSGGPEFKAGASVEGGPSIVVARAGVGGEVNIITVKPELVGVAELKIGGNWQFCANLSANTTLRLLNGSLFAFVEVRYPWVEWRRNRWGIPYPVPQIATSRYEHSLFNWNGINREWTIFSLGETCRNVEG